MCKYIYIYIYTHTYTNTHLIGTSERLLQAQQDAEGSGR